MNFNKKHLFDYLNHNIDKLETCTPVMNWLLENDDFFYDWLMYRIQQKEESELEYPKWIPLKYLNIVDYVFNREK